MIAAAILLLIAHILWLALVIFGVVFTRGRPVWSALHILALLWGIATESGPWPCPLTLAEQYFEQQAGWAAYQGSFLLHYLNAIVSPGLPAWLLTAAGLVVCGLNLAIYLRRLAKYLAVRSHRPSSGQSTPPNL
jgi:hypothetical protein